MDRVISSAVHRDVDEPRDYRRIEVIAGTSRRRRWTVEQKAALVAESFRPGINISSLARTAGVNRGLLQTWRRDAVRGVSDAAPAFVPIHVEEGVKSAQTHAITEDPPQGIALLPADTASGSIEIEAGGMRIRVQGTVDISALQAVLARAGRRR